LTPSKVPKKKMPSETEAKERVECCSKVKQDKLPEVPEKAGQSEA
jgi:hypothetical protein